MFAWRITVLLTVWMIGTPASGEIFRCLTKEGLDRYQNFPCVLDSLGLPSPSSPAPATVAAKTSIASSEAAREPTVGMSEAQVREIWGEPDEIIQDEPPDGRIEIWRYGEHKSVQFSNKRRVLLVLP